MSTYNKPINCIHCENNGSCRVYSNLDVEWKCPGDGDCEKYMESYEDE